MTLGATNREMRDLTVRVAALEGNAARAYRRLILWSTASAFVGGALVVLAYLAK
jgi:hypothetical protein